MKSFFKFTLASILGFIIASILITFISIAIINGIVSSTNKPVEVKSNSILVLKLSKEIVDRASEDPFENFNPMNLETEWQLGLNSILENIKKAKAHEDIKGIYLNLSTIQAPWATTEEIRNQLADFKSSGKFIVAYSDMFSQKAYYLASVADEVYINPEGMFDFRGLGSQVMFFKEAFKKMGVEFQAIRMGKFKSAIEPFVNDEMSPENRQQINRFLSLMWDNIVSSIATDRGISKDMLVETADELSVFADLDFAVQNGLVDGLKYKDEVIDVLKSKVGISESKKLKSMSLSSFKKVPMPKDYKGLAKNKIAVVYAQGGVVLGNEGEGYISSERISRAIREARKDSAIKAIVFRVNSGGGSALASDIIHRELELAAQVKPVIASMGDLAASGGYYVLACADTIVANPNTLTGSIGVLGLIPNAQELFNDKLGIKIETEKTSASADLMTPFRPMSNHEKNVMQKMVATTYDTFLGRVSDGRDLTKEYVDSIGQGRVWNAVDAKRLGLVDVLGGLTTAIDIAAEKTGVEQYRVVSLPKQEDSFEAIVKKLSGEEAHIKLLKKNFGSLASYIKVFKEIDKNKGIQAVMPFVIEIE
jgi:protease-4